MIPKFRAWDMHEEVMNRVDYIDFAHGVVGMSNENVKDYEQPIHRVKIMQSTGLVSRFGVEMFENDIVTNGQGELGRIIYLIQEAGWVVATGERDYRLGHRNTGEPYNIASNHGILGNIYENPELIE